MPTVIEPGRIERESLAEFLRKHLPTQWYIEEKRGKGEGETKGRQLLAIKYFFEPVSGEVVEAAVIRLLQHTTIEVDRSFLEFFTNLAEMYERYNPDVTVIVIVKSPESK